MAWQQDLIQVIVLTHVHYTLLNLLYVQPNQSYGY